MGALTSEESVLLYPDKAVFEQIPRPVQDRTPLGPGASVPRTQRLLCSPPSRRCREPMLFYSVSLAVDVDLDDG